MNEVLKLLDDKDFLDSLYGFAYKRTNNSYEAEDLCSEMIIAILSAARKNSDIRNHYAFVWTIARRVYADFSEKRKSDSAVRINAEYSDEIINIHTDPTADYVEHEDDKQQLRRIMREICFMSKIHRDVCVMYYLDEMRVSEIAARLDITENAVKQRLHSARVAIKKGIEKMDNTNLTLKPVDIHFSGSGNPVGNDPREVATRSFSKNLVYLCKDTERSVKELSELLNVPMSFVEEEVEIQLRGQNGYYGLLQKTESGKYISNCIIVDYDDYMKVSEMYKKNTDTIAERFDAYLKRNEERILAMPFLNKQTDVRFIAWSLISRVNYWFTGSVEKRLEEKYFSGITPTKRDFFTFGIATKEGQYPDIGFYGWDGIHARNINGYSYVHMSNIYGRRIKAHFHCGHDVANDLTIQAILEAIKGIKAEEVSGTAQETIAKALEAGYLKKEGDMIYPKILVTESEEVYWDIINDFISEANDLSLPIIDEMYDFVKKYVPKHLMGEYRLFVSHTASGLLDAMIEKCIELGTLIPPEKTPFAEGVMMTVQK